MRKEVIFALILGVLLGGVILYGINLANKAASLNSTGKMVSPQPQGQTTPQPEPALSILTPDDHAVVFDSNLPIKGTTKPNATVVITGENDEKIVTADVNGAFETSYDLEGGQNIININAFLSDTPVATASIEVVYTTSKIN